MGVVINRIDPQTCDLYSPEGEYLGTLNEYQFMDVRCQIKEQQLEGYYCEFKLESGETHKFKIDKNGRSNDWNEETFGTMEKLFRRFM